MHPLLQVATLLVFGAVAALATGELGLPTGIVFLVLAIPIVRGRPVLGLGALLLGFGATFGLGLLLQARRGGYLDDAEFWTGIAVGPLVAGSVSTAAALLGPLVRRARAPRG
jgi:hypothetical protein